MKLEFADKGTFSYWIQGFYAGCVHPSAADEALARSAWNAAIKAAAQMVEERESFQQPGPQDRHHDVIGTASRAVASEIRKLQAPD